MPRSSVVTPGIVRLEQAVGVPPGHRDASAARGAGAALHGADARA